MKPVYRSSFVLKVPRSTEGMSSITPVESLIKKLDERIDEKQFKELSMTLGMNEDEVKELVSLKTKRFRRVFRACTPIKKSSQTIYVHCNWLCSS
jgi:hypothetical protein